MSGDPTTPRYAPSGARRPISPRAWRGKPGRARLTASLGLVAGLGAAALAATGPARPDDDLATLPPLERIEDATVTAGGATCPPHRRGAVPRAARVRPVTLGGRPEYVVDLCLGGVLTVGVVREGAEGILVPRAVADEVFPADRAAGGRTTLRLGTIDLDGVPVRVAPDERMHPVILGDGFLDRLAWRRTIDGQLVLGQDEGAAR